MESKMSYSVGEKVMVKVFDIFGKAHFKRGIVRGVGCYGVRYGVEFMAGGGAWYWRSDIFPLVNIGK